MIDAQHTAAPPAVTASAGPNDSPTESQTPKKIKKRQTPRNKRKLKPRLRLLRAQMLVEQDYRCAHCGCVMITEPHHPNSATLDHIIPRARGGTDIPDNLVVACMRCNSTRKHALLTGSALHARAIAAITADKARPPP